MDVWHAGLVVAAAALTKEASNLPPWWATEVIKLISTLAATIAGIWVGAWLITRREAAVRHEQRAEDALFLAITISGKLEEFSSACASVSGDDGTSRGQPDVDGRRVAQVKAPRLSYADFSVVWKSIPAKLLDDLYSIPRRLQNAEDYLSFIHQECDDEQYFAERQRRYTNLGLYAAEVSERVRTSVGLAPQIDPESNTVTWLGEQRDRFKAIDERREEQDRKMHEELSGMAAASSP